MSDILVLAEHRRGELRDVTFEMIGKARELAGQTGAQVTAVLLGSGAGALAERLASVSPRVLVLDDESFAKFDAEAYQAALLSLMQEKKPLAVLIGHTAFGVDVAPSLAVEAGLPLATDCVGLDFEDGKPVVIRPVYTGKALTKVAFKERPGYVFTIQAGAFAPAEPLAAPGEIVTARPAATGDGKRKFVEYIESGAGDQDITQYDVVVGVGRGIGDAGNIPVVEDLANALGAALACSRPVVDSKWLPKFRQVGISGKTIKPKVYIAVGISGAFQHLVAIRGAGMVVAINKDPKAPIFTVADYGIVGDLFKVVPALKNVIVAMKSGK